MGVSPYLFIYIYCALDYDTRIQGIIYYHPFFDKKLARRRSGQNIQHTATQIQANIFYQSEKYPKRVSPP